MYVSCVCTCKYIYIYIYTHLCIDVLAGRVSSSCSKRVRSGSDIEGWS